MLVFSISSFRKPLSKASAYLSAVTENFACPYALETATGPTSDRTASAARVCRVRCGVGTFFSAAFYCAASPEEMRPPTCAAVWKDFPSFAEHKGALYTKSPPPSVDGGRGTGEYATPAASLCGRNGGLGRQSTRQAFSFMVG